MVINMSDGKPELFELYNDYAYKVRKEVHKGIPVNYINDESETELSSYIAMFVLQVKLNKFIWSVSNRPSYEQNIMALLSETAEILDEFKPKWKWWGNGGNVNVDNVKEEIIDWLHFYLTHVQITTGIGNIAWLNPLMDDNESYILEDIIPKLSFNPVPLWSYDEILEEIVNLFRSVATLYYRNVESEVVESIEKLIGTYMDSDEVFEKYVEKSFENYMRQVQGGRYGKGVTIEDLKNYIHNEFSNLF